MLWWLLLLAAGVPALLLSLTRLLDPQTPTAVLAQSFTPLALPAYAVVLLLALGRLRGVPGRRAAGALAGVVALALAGLLLHGAWFAARALGPNPAPGADAASALTVLQANTLMGAADGAALLRTAREERADVLVVEEITPDLLGRLERAGVGHEFPHRIGRPRAGGAGGTMVFSRTPLRDAHPVATSAEGWRVRVDGLTLLAVHPEYPLHPATWRADLATVLREARAHDADLVVGDLNATLDHRPMRRLAAAGFRSAAELADEGWQPTWPAGGRERVLGVPLPGLVQIDHVLLGHRLAALGTHTVDLPGSDHRGLVARVARR